MEKTVYKQLGIEINVSRVAMCFDEKGTNSENMKAINENLAKINDLKKKGVVKPVNTLEAPKKPVGVSAEEWNKNPLRVEYLQKKALFDDEMRKYEQYNSTEYIRANLAYKLTCKLTSLLQLLEKNKEKPTESRTKKIQEIFEELKGGITKPIFGDKVEKNGRVVRPIVGRETIIKFVELGELTENPEELKRRLEAVSLEFASTNLLFKEKNELSAGCLRFSESVRTAVAYVLQEAIVDLLRLAVKDCKKTDKLSLSIDNFRNEVISAPPFAPLFYNLPCLKTLQEYLLRKSEYDQEKREHDKKMRSKKKPSMIRSFEECERSGGFMKVENDKLQKKSKKRWIGLSVEKSDVNFNTYVGHLFDILNVKLRLSSRAKELVSCIMYQFLTNLSKRFQIHRLHRNRVSSLEGKETKNEKTIKFETVIEMFEILLCSEHEDIKKVINNVCLFRQNLKKLKSKK